MKIVALVENATEQQDLQQKHGLCLYLETERHHVLFDLGPDETFVQNAARCGVDLQAVDTVIISHGHADHGGGLRAFLDINNTAKVYVHSDAFLPHYNKVLKVPLYCGLDTKLQHHPQIIHTGNRYIIDKNLILFADVEGNKCVPSINQFLLERRGKQRVPDTFTHEQSLIVQEEGKTILVGGCAHRGIINIMKQAHFITSKPMNAVVSGFHLSDSSSIRTESVEFLDKLAYNLDKYPCAYFTCHCTGREAYYYLAEKLGEKMHYLATGDEIVL